MNADVIIVGLGPTGAALAGLLAKRGVRVLGVEKSHDVFPQPRAAHIDHTGLRTVQELGCLDAVLPPMIRNKSLDLVNAEHELLSRLDASQSSVSGLPTSVYFYQPHFDRVLRDTVSAMPGVETRFGEEMVGFTQGADGVKVRTAASDGRETTYRARWLVGCDGAWSPVREAMGSQLESLDFDERWLVLDLIIKGDVEELPIDRVVQVCDPARPHLTTPISKGRQRFEFMLLEGEDPDVVQQPDSIARLLSSWMTPENYEIERRAIYTFHGLVARNWRAGRVLIGGDAAHQMPPFLGQGMCSGLRDAANLAWKLAGVINETLPEWVLDTYEPERSPHVKKITEAAIGFGRLVCMTDPQEAAARDRRLLASGQDASEQAAFQLPRLAPGPLVLEGGGGMFIQPEHDGSMLDDVVGTGFLVLARHQSALGHSAAWWKERLGATVLALDVIENAALLAWMDRFSIDVAVIRPDRYVLVTGKSLNEITARMQRIVDGQPGSMDGARDAAMMVS